ELLASLPIAGRDGTLKNRMHGTQAFGRLRGKTGSIDGVAAITGVVQSRGGELLAFSVMMNDDSKDGTKIRTWQDPFGQALAEFNRKSAMAEKPAGPGATIGDP
ncbi:MAG: D-alanyl-D-alanine carboxypeptidase, partial [Bdellovibrionota bacterium]